MSKEFIEQGKVCSSILRNVAVLLFLSVFIHSMCNAQNPKIDSLKSLLPVKSGTEYIDVVFELARAHGDIDYERSLSYANEAFHLAKQIGDSLRMVKAGRMKSRELRLLGKIDSAVILGKEILLLARRHNSDTEIKAILNGLGSSYLHTAEYDKALKYYFESLELREKDGNKLEIIVGLNNIGLIFYNLEDFDKAILYYKRALDLRRTINSKIELDILMLNIGLCFVYKNDFSQARHFANAGLAACNPNCHEESILIAQNIFGLISFRQKNFIAAKAQFLKSYVLSKKVGRGYHLNSLEYLIRIFIELNQPQLAEKYLKEAEELVQTDTPYKREIIQLYQQLFFLYGKSKNFEKMAFYQNKYITLKDSIYNEELTTNLMKVEAEHLEKENKAKIESQTKILALNEEVILRQKFMNAFIGIIAALLVALAFLLVRSNRQKKIVNKLLDDKVKERTQELEMNRDALQRVCEERDALINRASTDIKSSIATIKGLCFLGKKDIDHPNASQYLNKMDHASDQLSEVLNRMVYAYRGNR